MSRKAPDHQLPVSAFVITLNEEYHIGRWPDSVSRAANRVVVDSGRDDRTVEIAEEPDDT